MPTSDAMKSTQRVGERNVNYLMKAFQTMSFQEWLLKR